MGRPLARVPSTGKGLMNKPRKPHRRKGEVIDLNYLYANSMITPTGCEEWKWGQFGGSAREYGYVWDGKKGMRAHVLAWELANGRKVRDGYQVNHYCDNPPCCRPDHLYEGDHKDNMADRDRSGWKGGTSKYEKNGMSKLKSIEEARDIRRRYAEGGVTQEELGQDYKVTQANISDIVNHRTWKEDE